MLKCSCNQCWNWIVPYVGMLACDETNTEQTLKRLLLIVSLLWISSSLCMNIPIG